MNRKNFVSWKEFKSDLWKLREKVYDRDGGVWCRYMYAPLHGSALSYLYGTYFKNLKEAKNFWRSLKADFQ